MCQIGFGCFGAEGYPLSIIKYDLIAINKCDMFLFTPPKFSMVNINCKDAHIVMYKSAIHWEGLNYIVVAASKNVE
jgi:hypothetical protein